MNNKDWEARYDRLEAFMEASNLRSEANHLRSEEDIRKIHETMDRAEAMAEAREARDEARHVEIDAWQVTFGEKLDKLSKLYGGLGDNVGSTVEEFFYNALSARPVIKKIHFKWVYRNLVGSYKGFRTEFDLVLENMESILLIETKSKAREEDLEKLINTQAVNFRVMFPQYKNYSLHLGLASFHFHDDLIKMALDKNVSVLRRNGSIIDAKHPAENLPFGSRPVEPKPPAGRISDFLSFRHSRPPATRRTGLPSLQKQIKRINETDSNN